MDVERSPIQAGDYVRYNGHIAQVTETRLSAQGEHILTIEGGAIRVMQVACDRTEVVPDPRHPRLIADDPNDDGALPGETTEERVTRQREASARWMQGIIGNDHRDEVEGREQFGPPLEFTREGVEEWGRRQGDEIRVDVETNRDHIDVTAHVDGFESITRVSMFQLHRARDPFFMLRTASEAALQAVRRMAGVLRRSAVQTEELRHVTHNINFEPRFLDASGAADRLREMAGDVGLSMNEATRAMRSFQAQYTAQPGFITDIDDGASAEYGDEDHEFGDERTW